MKYMKYKIFQWLWKDIEKKYANQWKTYENQIKNYKERIKYMEWEIWNLKNSNSQKTK